MEPQRNPKPETNPTNRQKEPGNPDLGSLQLFVEWVAGRSGKEYNGGVLRIVCDVYA